MESSLKFKIKQTQGAFFSNRDVWLNKQKKKR